MSFLLFSVPTDKGGHPLNGGFEFQRISIDRSKMSEEEAFEHAIDMIQTRQMGFRKAAEFFSVSKWKLYKTARKRGIYAEIKKQNQAQALSKVPSNVQHFADLGVYKQLKKKTHLAKDAMFPHLPPGAPGAPGAPGGAGGPPPGVQVSGAAAVAAAAVAAVEAEVYKASTNNNSPSAPNAYAAGLQKKMLVGGAGGANGSAKDLVIDDDMEDDDDEADEAELEELEAEARRIAAAKAAARVAAAAAAADKDLVSLITIKINEYGKPCNIYRQNRSARPFLRTATLRTTTACW